MATWEDILGASTRTTATQGQRTTPAVIRRSDVMRQQPVTQAAWSALPQGGKQAEGPGGFMGALQSLIESPVGKVIGKAGEVISIPGRFVTSSINEIKDALDNDPNTEASWSDLGRQTMDPTFGFGTVIGDLFPDDSAWGRWGNRILGFAGDVLLDPLTYVTFGGSKALSTSSRVAGEALETGVGRAASKLTKPVTGRSGREALAVRVLDVTGDSELAKRAYRYGRSALADQSDDVFSQIGMDRAGVYFMGRRLGGTRIGEAVESGFAGMRTWSGDHIFKRAADVFTPNDVTEARKALARGNAPSERAESYLRLVVSDNLRRSAVAQASRKADAGLRAIVEEVGKKEFDAASPYVSRILEGELPMVDELTGLAVTSEQRVASKIAAYLDTLWKDVESAAKAVDPEFTMNKVKNYFPHVMSDDAIRWVTRSNTKSATALKEILFNPLDNAGSFKHRMTIDDEFFGVKLKDLDGPITVAKLNKIARDNGFRGDFFESNAAAVLQKYVGNYAEQMGLIARKGYLVEKGVFKKLSDAVKTDKNAIKQTKKMFKDATEARAVATSKAATKAREALAAVNKNALTAVGVYDAKTALDDAIAEMIQHSNSLSELYDEVPDAIRALEGEYERVVSELNAARAALESGETTLKEMQERLTQIEAEAQRINKIEEEIGLVGQFLQENLDHIMAGGSFAKDENYGDFGRALREAVKGVSGVAGTREAAVDAASRSDWWAAAVPGRDITPNQLKKMNAEQAGNIASAALRGDASIQEMRQAILWVASANPALRTQQPELWESLFGPDGIMVKAAKADQYYRSITKTRDSGRNFARIVSERTMLVAGERSVSGAIREYVAAQRLMREFLSPGAAGANAMDRLEDLLLRPEYQDLAGYFERFLGKSDDVSVRMGRLDDDDVLSILRGISGELSDGKEISFVIGYETTGKIGAPSKSRTFTVNMSQFIDDADWLVQFGTADDIDNFVELMMTGKASQSITGPPSRYADIDPSDIRKKMSEALNGRVNDRSVRGQLVALERRIAKDFPDIPLSYFGTETSATWRRVNNKLVVDQAGPKVGGAADVGRVIYEEAQSDLQEALTRAWFASDVYSRVEAATDVLAGAGLVPGLDIVQEIYNKVAREFLGEISDDIHKVNKAVSGMARIAEDIRTGVYDTPAKAYNAIEALLDDGDIAGLVARRRGASDAPRLLAKWRQMGGLRANTKDFLEAKSKNAKTASKMREAYKQELRDWYQSMFPGARRDTSIETIKEALDAASESTPGVYRKIGGRRVKVEQYGPNSTFEDLTAWLNSTVREVNLGARRLNRSRNWLVKAADPFMDPYDARPIGKVGWNMDLPSTLANTLRTRAGDMELASQEAARLGGRVSEARAAQAAAQSSADELDMLAETLGIPIGQRPRMPLSQAQVEGLTADDLKQVRSVVRELFTLKNSPEYFAAVERQELNDIIEMLAGVGAYGDVRIPILRSHVTIAKQWFESGTPIFIKARGSDRWVPVTSSSQITRDIPAGNIGYRATDDVVAGAAWATNDEISKLAQDRIARATAGIKNKATVKAYFKNLRVLDSKLENGKITRKSYDRQVAKLEDEIYAITKADRPETLEGIVPLPDEMGLIQQKINANSRNITRLKTQRDAIGDVEGADKLKAELQGKIDALVKENDAMRRASKDRVSSFVMKDGVEISFTPQEIESLFLTAGDMAGVQRLIDEEIPVATYLLELERDRTNGRIGAATRKMLKDMQMSDEARKIVDRWLSRPSSVMGGADIGGLAKVQADIAILDGVVRPAWEREIARLSRYRDRIDLLVKASDPTVQNAALMKAHYILQAVKRGDFTLDELTDGLGKIARADSWDVKARRAHLKGVWDSSSDKKYLDRVAEIEQSGQYASYRSVVRDADKARSLAERMRNEADRLESRAAAQFDYAEQQQVRFLETLGQITERLGDDIGYDAVARYEQLVTPVPGRRPKVYTPDKAIEVIRKEIGELVPTRSGPVATTGTLVAGPAKMFADDLNRLADEAAYLAKELSLGVDMATNKITLGVDVGLRKRAIAGIAERADNLADELDATKKAWAKEKKGKVAAGKKQAQQSSRKLQKAGKAYVDSIVKFDESKLFVMTGAEYVETVVPKLEANREQLVNFLERATQLASRQEDDVALVQDVLAWLDESEEVLDDLAKIATPEELQLMTRLKTDLLNMQSELVASSVVDSVILPRIQQGLSDGSLGRKVVKQVDRGFKSLKPYGMPSYQAEEWLSDMFVNMTRLEVPEFARSLSKFLGRYTGFFKAYAVSTPGFVVRNAMSNTFILVAAGADVKYMSEGLSVYRAWRQAVRSGDEAVWLAKQNPRVVDAIAAMDASGYGKATEALRAFNPKRKWLVDNRYVNTFRRSNEWFEGSARFMLAYDTVMKGGDFNEATARVKRYLFDYMTSTPGDDVMRTIVPFWFWMSRNLPMQVINQYENPRAYLLYEKSMRAIQAEEDEDDVVPLWLRQAGGVKIADGLYLNPDLGFNKLNQQLEELADPMRLMSYVNPGLRVPLEAVFADRKLYRDIPFSDKAQPTPGGPIAPAVQALAMMLGQSKDLPGGEMGTTDRFNYALGNLVPPIAQLSRLAPKDDYGKERQRSNWASYFGIPVREVTDSMIQAELRRRRREGE